MKKSIAYLPQQKQDDLRQVVALVREELPDCEMIILYGSYARNSYVDYDQRTEYGVYTYFMSDYDILVVTASDFKNYIISNILSRVMERFYEGKNRAFYTSIQFISENIKDLNKAIDRGLYFYTDIKKEGILLYDSGKSKLARRRKLNFQEIEELAREYFSYNFGSGEEFISIAKYSYEQGLYIKASFLLHQACESFYHTVILTFTLYTHKDHSLKSLSGAAKTHSLELSKPFPRDTKEEKRLFELLSNAYVQSRYNSLFVVTKEDVDALLPKVEQLRDIVGRECGLCIEGYRQKKREEKSEDGIVQN